MTTLTQITVPFHNAELYLVEHDGQPYTPMKPIVEGMGLAWQSQLAKLNANPQ
ncbi:phage antirepressor N-terminal domain-containing protein, partial [Acinetobacter baumannii]